MQIHFFIFNNDTFDNAIYLHNKLISLGEHSHLIDKNEYKNQWNKAIELFKGDVLFIIESDVQIYNIVKLIKKCKHFFNRPNAGIYSPDIYWTNGVPNKNLLADLGYGCKRIVNIDDGCWAVKSEIVKSIETFDYDGGIGMLASYLCNNKSLLVVRDYSILVHRKKTIPKEYTAFLNSHENIKLFCEPRDEFKLSIKRNKSYPHKRKDYLDLDYFVQLPKNKVKPHQGIITATDSNFFLGFELLCYSVQLSHSVKIAVFDLGMTQSQLNWCDNHNIEILRLPNFMLKNYFWQTWNKVFYIDNSPFEQTLWLDSDIIVRGNIVPLFNLLEKQPVFIECNAFSHYDRIMNSCNESRIYKTMPTEQRGPPFINAGVLGFDKNRDKKILDDWRLCVQKSSTRADLATGFKWWDQGALQWAIENNNQLHQVITRYQWNDSQCCCRDDEFNNINSLIIKLSNDSNMSHISGNNKPWLKWKAKSIFALEKKVKKTIRKIVDLDKSLKIFILGHNDKYKNLLPRRPFFIFANLNNLNIPSKFNNNQVSESRIFLSKEIDEIDSEYIGFLTHEYNNKYPNLTRLEKLHHVLELHPKNVIVGAIANEQWAWDSDYCHPYMMSLLEELSAKFGMSLNEKTFWANNFICHKDVLKEFIPVWRSMFDYLWKKYQFALPFCTGDFDIKRHGAFLYERITMLYFANRDDLQIQQIKNYNSPILKHM